MLDQIIPWTAPTAYGLLGLAVMLVLFGFLVPIRQVRRELQREREIAEYYRKAAEASDARADKLADILADAVKQQPLQVRR
jgi:hypothetical protein